jgi:transcriptional regulator with XRE-family HTH domain
MAARGVKAKPLSKRAGLSESAVRDLLKKVDDPRINTILGIADALNVSHEYLTAGRIPLKGTIGPDGLITMGNGNPEDTVPRPPTEERNLWAFRVAGNMLRPGYRGGDVIYVAPNGDTPAQLIGEECVCQIDGGHCYLRTLLEGSKTHLKTLRADYGQHIADIRDEPIAWAAPVLHVMRVRRPADAPLNGTNHI